jgi:GDPmannose 4,6-dehydratase
VIPTWISTTTVRDFVIKSFAHFGIELRFEGNNENEKVIILKCNKPEYQLPDGQNGVSFDKRYYRRTEVDLLIGDAAKAKEKIRLVTCLHTRSAYP